MSKPLPEPLQDVGIVYFGNDWYAENRTSSHHMARRLAQRMPLLYVDSPGMRAPTATGRDLRRLWRKLRETLRPPREVSPGFWHCTVPQLPLHGVPGIAWLNRCFGRWAVRRAMRRAGIGAAISWFVVPHPGFLAHQLGERLCVYYCIDDYAAHPGVDAQRVARSDAALTHRADLVFVAPPALLEAKRRANAATHFAPHGVDAELFARALDPQLPLPEAVQALPRPIIGFFGLIAAWIDIDLLAWLAQQRPQWSFLLVGHEKTDTGVLHVLPNVHRVGAQPYESLPRWAKGFDVALIPYRLNRQVRNANPLKLREYLAAGRRVVAVRNPEIERFARWLRIADDREDFLRGIEEALLPEPAAAALERAQAMQACTWDARAAEVLEIVAAALQQLPASEEGAHAQRA